MKFAPSLLRAAAAASLSFLMTGVCAGQAASPRESGLEPSRFEVSTSYMYVKPVNSAIGAYKYQDINAGALFGARYFFTPHFGIEGEGSYAPGGSDTHCWITKEGGLVARMQRGRFVPFVHALGGAAQIGGPALQFCDGNGWGVTGGGGLDYVLPVLNNHVAVRAGQVDFTYAHKDNGPLLANGLYGGVGDIYAMRFSAGLTFRLGHFGPSMGKADTTLTCSVDPGESFPGTPLVASAGAMNLKDGRELRYLWTTTGGTIKGTEATEPLDTKGLAPGTYNVNVRMVRGDRERTLGTCMTSFVIASPVPPTISCSADKAAINSGTPVTITSVAQSATGRPLSYSYSATNGQVTGDGPTAQLSTIGSTPGTITVTCRATDDKGLTGQATASVVIATPAPLTQAQAAQPTASNLCTLSFVRDTRRPARVDNEAKGCLDDIALTLGRDPSTKLLLVGSHVEGERANTGAERVLNAADYLVNEKGIDRARLDLRTTTAAGQQVSTLLLVPGATVTGDTIDATRVRRSGQPYGMPGRRVGGVRHRARRRHRRVAATAGSTSAPATAPTHIVY